MEPGGSPPDATRSPSQSRARIRARSVDRGWNVSGTRQRQEVVDGSGISGTVRPVVGVLIACATVSVGLAACTSRPSDGTTAAPPAVRPPEPARLQFVALKGGRTDTVLLRARTGCRRISAVHDRAAGHDAIVGVQVSGPTDCGRFPRRTRLTVTLHAGGVLGCTGGRLIDASTGRPMPLAPEGHWPVFNCPAERPS